MAPPFVACRICRRVEGKLKNYTDSPLLIRAYEKLTGCTFVELLYLTKFCPRCACMLRKMYNFRRNCILAHNNLIDHLNTGRKVTKPFITRLGPIRRLENLSTWEPRNVHTIDLVHNPKAKSKKKIEFQGVINIKHVTVPKDPSAEIPIETKTNTDSEYDYSRYLRYNNPSPEPLQLRDFRELEYYDYETSGSDYEEPMNVYDAPMNNLETMKQSDVAVNVLDAPVNVLEVPVNVLEEPVNVLEESVNVLEESVNVLEEPVNVLEEPVNVFEAYVLCEPDLAVNEENDEAEVKIEEMVEEVSPVTADVKVKLEADPDDLTLHEIKAEMLATGTDVAMEDVDVERRIKRTRKKKDKEGRMSKRSQRARAGARRNKSSEELEEHFAITQFLTEDEQMQEFLKRREGEGYLEGKYKCELCLKSFKEQKWMDAHVKKHEPAAGSFVCGICKIRCRTPKLFRTHRDCNHTTRYSCRRCNYYTYSKAQALKHHGWHEGVQHTCQHCGATFRKHTTYMGHVRRAHPSAHICGACARSFVSAYGLNLHVKAAHKELTSAGHESARCEQCDVTFVSRQMYVRHVLTTDRHEDIARDILGCRKCGEQFDTKEEMDRHTHYKERKYVRRDAPRQDIKCDQCGEVFSHPNGVYQHYLRAHPHTPYRFAVRRRYLCDQCGKTFKSPGLLQQHALTHLGLRPAPARQPPGRYTCRTCGNTYSKLSGLFRHKLTHTGVRRHKCHICEKAFTDTSNLKQHVQGVHLNIRRIRKR